MHGQAGSEELAHIHENRYGMNGRRAWEEGDDTMDEENDKEDQVHKSTLVPVANRKACYDYGC